MPDDADVTYAVKRHGDHRNHEWRLVGRWHDLDTAAQFFRAEVRAMRQGRVILVNEATNVTLESAWGPRLRTRW